LFATRRSFSQEVSDAKKLSCIQATPLAASDHYIRVQEWGGGLIWKMGLIHNTAVNIYTYVMSFTDYYFLVIFGPEPARYNAGRDQLIGD